MKNNKCRRINLLKKKTKVVVFTKPKIGKSWRDLNRRRRNLQICFSNKPGEEKEKNNNKEMEFY